MGTTWSKAEILRGGERADEEKLTAVVRNQREMDGRKEKKKKRTRGLRWKMDDRGEMAIILTNSLRALQKEG